MYENENKRDIHARSSSAARLATPCHASSRRDAGCGNEPSRCKFLPRTTGIRKVTRKLKRFAVVEIEYERRTSSPTACSFRLPRSLQLPAQPLAFFSCAYKREVAAPESLPPLATSS